MTEGICIPSQGAWSLIKPRPEPHVPTHWLDRSPLARDEAGRFSSED